MNTIFGVQNQCKGTVAGPVAHFDFTYSKRYTVFGHLGIIRTHCVTGPAKFLLIILKVTEFFLQLSSKSLLKASNHGKEYTDAYLFVKAFASFHQHPIILNYTAKSGHYRHLLRLTKAKFTKLLNDAIRLGLASIEGNNLRLRSNSKDKREFKQRNTEIISHKEAKQFLYYSLIRKHIKQQQKAIAFKSSTIKNVCSTREDVLALNPSAKFTINDSISLSVRAAADLFSNSVSYAHTLLQRLKTYGLTLTNNSVQISKETFKQCLSQGNPNIRCKDGQYSYVLAQSVSWNHFRSKSVAKSKTKEPYYLNDNW
jgi:hypothetical protein